MSDCVKFKDLLLMIASLHEFDDHISWPVPSNVKPDNVRVKLFPNLAASQFDPNCLPYYYYHYLLKKINIKTVQFKVGCYGQFSLENSEYHGF
jgi:hypothetical protein